jgi:tetratricopeptide (TPR) repeat protein
MKNFLAFSILLLFYLWLFTFTAEAQVKVYTSSITIPTYELKPPYKHPTFYQPEVYQGAQLRVYPYPNNIFLTNNKVAKTYKGLFLENEYLKVCVLPELGGRIYFAIDKITGNDMFYRNKVIKPAIIGMTGAWISGGVEWNIPHHHRATSVMPVNYTLENNSDGSKTIWVGETEKRSDTRWIVGLRLSPGKAVLETTIRYLNATPIEQSFLAWANTAVTGNPDYQVIFPPDVERAVFHSKTQFTDYPIANQFYTGIDFRGNKDLSWWKNTTSPTSFFAWGSNMDFMAGYDHAKKAGVLLVGDHHIFPGKKFWNWGNNDVQRMWDQMLTDNDGPYLELMMGMYSDNQPDYSWNNPYGIKSGTMYYAPIRNMPSVKNANQYAAVNISTIDGSGVIQVHAYETFRNARLVLFNDDREVYAERVSLTPLSTYQKEIKSSRITPTTGIKIYAANGKELIAYQPKPLKNEPLPDTYHEPLPPSQIKSADELFLTGLRIEQFHNAVYDPLAYYQEALKRDSLHFNANTQLGIWYLKQLDDTTAEKYLRKAVNTLTKNHTRPKYADCCYYLGICLLRQEQLEEAKEWLQRAAWDSKWIAPSLLQAALIESRQQYVEKAISLLERSLQASPTIEAHNALAMLQRKKGSKTDAVSLIKRSLTIDPLNPLSRSEQWLQQAITNKQIAGYLGADEDNYLNIASFYNTAGLHTDALKVLKLAEASNSSALKGSPLLYYYTSYTLHTLKEEKAAEQYLQKAKLQSLDYCFPHGHTSLKVLRYATKANPLDAQAWYLLGNILADVQPGEALKAWEKAAAADSSLAVAYRNAAFVLAQHFDQTDKAIAAVEKAVQLNPSEAMWLLEADTYHEYAGYSAEKRLAYLNRYAAAVDSWDKTVLQKVDLLIQTGDFDGAITLLKNNHFYIAELTTLNPHNSWSDAHWHRGLAYLQQKEYDKAVTDFEAMQDFPRNLEIARDAKPAIALYWLGKVYEAKGDKKTAQGYFEKMADNNSEKMGWGAQQLPIVAYYQAKSFEALNFQAKADSIYHQMINQGQHDLQEQKDEEFKTTSVRIRLQKRNTKGEAYYNIALGNLGLKNVTEGQNAMQEALRLNQTLNNPKYIPDFYGH